MLRLRQITAASDAKRGDGTGRERKLNHGKMAALAAALMLVSTPGWPQAARPPAQPNWWSAPAREDGPTRFVWAAQKEPETKYKGPDKPIWHIADILKSHHGKPRWEQRVLLNRDFDGRYVQMAPGDKTKCQFWADDRAWGWIYSGQVKVTIDGQEPKVIGKGWVYNVAPRLSYCMETVGSEPVGMFNITPTGQVPSYPDSETPTPVKGYRYVRTKISSTGGYDSFNTPFFNEDEYAASTRTGERFLYDGHPSSDLTIGPPITQLPPDTRWGPFRENMQEVWLNVYAS